MPHPYATVDQVLTAYKPALSAVGVGSFDVSTQEVSSYYIFAAQGVVDGYFARRYNVPIDTTPVPALVTKLTVDLVVYDMFRDKSLSVPEFMQDRFDAALKMLKDIADGGMSLPGATEVASGDNEAFSTAQGYHPVFSPVLSDIEQAVDRDLVEAERDERFGDVDEDVP